MTIPVQLKLNEELQLNYNMLISLLSFDFFVTTCYSFLPVGPGHGYDDRVLPLYFYYPGEYAGAKFNYILCWFELF